LPTCLGPRSTIALPLLNRFFRAVDNVRFIITPKYSIYLGIQLPENTYFGNNLWLYIPAKPMGKADALSLWTEPESKPS